MNYPFVLKENNIQETDIGWIRENFKHVNENGFMCDIIRILERNGWEFVEEDEWGAVWEKDFTVEYRTTVYAKIGYKPEHLDGCWSYGVQWLECEYEYSHNISVRELKDMAEGMRIGLENLLAIGIPFHPRSDISRQVDFYHLSNQQIKRNIDLLNATRLLEFNYLAVKELLSERNENFSIKEWWKKEGRNRNREYEWMCEFIDEEE